ncbi:MAG: hypothetical protein ACREJM_14945 [Candidatus Saccharimonadales bacterium]
MANTFERTDSQAAKDGNSLTHSQQFPSWGWFLSGLAAGLIVLYVVATRPIAGQLTQLEDQIASLERNMNRLVSKRGRAVQANDLLSALTEQGRRAQDAAESLKQIKSLHSELIGQHTVTADATRSLAALNELRSGALEVGEQTAEVRQAIDALGELQDKVIAQYHSITSAQQTLSEIIRLHRLVVSEAEEVGEARRAIEGLAELKTRSLAAGEEADRAGEVANKLVGTQQRLIRAAGDVDQARAVGRGLAALKDEILCGNDADQIEEARAALGGLADLRQQLQSEGDELAPARASLDGLVAIKDQVLARTSDLAEAVETLETLGDLEHQLVASVQSFDRIRRWLVEAVLIEPAVERASAMLKPLMELSNLRRLNPADLRQAARSIADQRSARVATKPSAAAEATPVETD